MTLRTRVPRTLWIALAAPLILGAPALAADELTWKLGADKLRLDLQKDGEAPAGAPSLQIVEHHLLGEADFPDGRRAGLPVNVPGDLVWHYALTIPKLPSPEGKRRKRGRPITLEVSERFPIAKGHFEAKGNRSVRIKGKRWQVRSSILITCTQKTSTFKKGNLVVNSVFDVKRGRLEMASYTFEVSSIPPGDNAAPRTDTWQGKIVPARPVRVASKDFHGDVQAAITKGTAWLRKETTKRLQAYKAATKPAHQRQGMLALPCFALLRSGVAPRDLAGEIEWCGKQPLETTYSVALWVMLLEARSIKRNALPPRNETRSVTRFERGKLPKPDKELMARAVEWLIKTRKHGEGWWSYYGNLGEGAETGPLGHDRKTVATSGDRSNSQFAVLALHSALASGIEVPGKVWVEITQEALKSQAKKGPGASLRGSVYGDGSPYARDVRDRVGDPNEVGEGTRERAKPGKEGTETREEGGQARGWSYGSKRRPNGGAYGSMSAAGVSTLAICREGLRRTGALTPKLDRQILAAMRDGLCWLLRNYDPARNPKREAQWYFYYAYSLEKAMDTAGVERLGMREWWRDVAAELLGRQLDTGSWGTIEQTSFALLVLNRATLPAKLEISEAERRKTGEQDASLWDRVVVEGVGQLQLRKLFKAMAEAPQAAAKRLPLAKRGLLVLPEVDRPRLVPELLLLRDHRHKATRKWARATLEELAGTDEPKRLSGFVERWETVRVAGEAHDYSAMGELSQIITKPTTPLPLLEHALLVGGRLRALELVDPILRALDTKDADRRAKLWQHLVTLIEGAPDFDPKGSASARKGQLDALRAHWRAHGPEQLQAEHIRRWVSDLSFPGRTKRAEKHLVKAGESAVPSLIDALRGSGAARKTAHTLLTAITGQKLSDKVDAWQEWWEKSRKKR